MRSEGSIEGTGRSWFHPTQWDLVFTARHGLEAQRSNALEELCRSYWQPLYKFIRAKNFSESDAQDLTQEFFQHLFKQDFLSHLKHRNGKFRTFLLTFLTHFLSDQRDRANAQKRGRQFQFISLDEFALEEHFHLSSAQDATPEETFDRRWALAVSQNATQRLTGEFEKKGKLELLRVLNRISQGSLSIQEGAASLKMSIASLKTAQTRLKKRYLDHLHSEIANCSPPDQAEAEYHYLMKILARKNLEME